MAKPVLFWTESGRLWWDDEGTSRFTGYQIVNPNRGGTAILLFPNGRIEHYGTVTEAKTVAENEWLLSQ